MATAGRPVAITAAVLKYLTDRMGQVCYLPDIVEATQLTPQQVQSAINNYRNRKVTQPNEVVLTTHVRGNAFSAAPGTAKKSKPVEMDSIYEQLGLSSTGDIIVRGVDTRRVYRLQEL